MEPKITMLLGKATRLKKDFLNCHQIKIVAQRISKLKIFDLNSF